MTSSKLIFILFLIVFFSQLPAGWVIHKISLTVGIIINQLVVMLSIPISILMISGNKLRINFSASPKIRVTTAIVASIVLTLLTDYLLAGTDRILPVPEDLHEGMKRLVTINNLGEYFLKLFLLAMLPSVCEEIFFRGICQTALTARYGKALGILIASAFFAIAHANPWYIHLYLLLGIFLGWIYEAGGTIWLPIMCHFANNFWTITTNYLGIKFPIGNIYIDAPITVCSVILLIFLIHPRHELG